MHAVLFGFIFSAISIVAGQRYSSANLSDLQLLHFHSWRNPTSPWVISSSTISFYFRMQKVKRKQSKDEENDSSSRKRRKADLSKPVSFVSTGNVEISRAESSYVKIGS
ncbi:hypothetical protein NC653_004775 [Populus alba x Populus x berolinensis]|uniref:Uncharacterized protein n=2 Tax=Populus alba x Populus x berolinensis TaxID=444605 RepID=A0AAD6WJQ2_9ROSI|nr:hypothetical protein NC653_004775 [Populus alba x Populus x berolinensis]